MVRLCKSKTYLLSRKCSCQWRPGSSTDALIAYDNTKVSVVNVEEINTVSVCTISVIQGQLIATHDTSVRASRTRAAVWDPHHRAQCYAIAAESTVRAVDTRTNEGCA
jgi:hypothetical protein